MKKILILLLSFSLIHLCSYAQKSVDELNIQNQQLKKQLNELQEKVKKLTTDLGSITTTLVQITNSVNEDNLPTDVLTLQKELKKAKEENDWLMKRKLLLKKK